MILQNIIRYLVFLPNSLILSILLARFHPIYRQIGLGKTLVILLTVFLLNYNLLPQIGYFIDSTHILGYTLNQPILGLWLLGKPVILFCKIIIWLIFFFLINRWTSLSIGRSIVEYFLLHILWYVLYLVFAIPVLMFSQ